jgi:hypothetical protein
MTVGEEDSSSRHYLRYAPPAGQQHVWGDGLTLRRKWGTVMRILSAALAALLLGGPASAYTVVGFEGINAGYPPAGPAQILGFYDGGTSSVGTSGANFGMSFDANAIAVCLNSLTITCSNGC